jgi:hypothetical protein
MSAHPVEDSARNIDADLVELSNKIDMVSRPARIDSNQWHRMRKLTRSLESLLVRRHALETLYSDYPDSIDHGVIQAAAIDRAEAFFQGVYSTPSQLAAVVRAFLMCTEKVFSLNSTLRRN